jgi:chorismate mutase
MSKHASILEKEQHMNHDLQDLRKSLDNLDNALVFLLAERFRVTQKVGEYKKANNLPAVDEAREAAQFARIEALATQAGLEPTFAKAMLRLIIDEVVKNHQALAKA